MTAWQLHTADEITRLREALDRWEVTGSLATRWRFAQLVRLLLLTGARLREVMCAEWSWVDWQRSVLLVPAERGKTGAAEVQLSQRAVAILRELQEAEEAMGGRCRAVIDGAERTGPLVGYRKRWLALLADAGIEGLRIHDLRHSFASYALSGGQTLGVVGQLLGLTVHHHRSAQLRDAAQRHAEPRNTVPRTPPRGLYRPPHPKTEPLGSLVG